MESVRIAFSILVYCPFRPLSSFHQHPLPFFLQSTQPDPSSLPQSRLDPDQPPGHFSLNLQAPGLNPGGSCCVTMQRGAGGSINIGLNLSLNLNVKSGTTSPRIGSRFGIGIGIGVGIGSEAGRPRVACWAAGVKRDRKRSISTATNRPVRAEIKSAAGRWVSSHSHSKL